MEGTRHRGRRLVAAAAAACAAGPLASCDGDAPPASATPSDTEVAAPSPEQTTECRRAERRTARNIWLWRTVDEVTNFPAAGERSRAELLARVSRVAGRLAQDCPEGTPPAFARFREDLDRATAGPRFGDAQLDRVLAAWLRWGEAVGGPGPARAQIDALRECRHEFHPHFDATYAIRSEPTETGTVWWVELTFENRTGRILDGSMGGTAQVHKMLPDPFGWDDGPRPGPGRDAVLSWGGSSAEVLELRPGTTRLTAAPDIDEDVHTAPGGTFRVVGLELSLTPRGQHLTCTPAYRRAA